MTRKDLVRYFIDVLIVHNAFRNLLNGLAYSSYKKLSFAILCHPLEL